MRIAYVCADRGVPVFGQKGCSIHVQEVIAGLIAQGARVDLFATRLEGDPPSGLENVRLHALPAVPRVDGATREQAALAANHGLQTALLEEGPFELVYERYSLWSFAGMVSARAMGIPGLLEVNSPLILEEEGHRGLSDRAGAERVAERAFGAASALIAVSEEVGAYLENFPEARGRIYIVPNGVNPERFPEHQEPALPAPPGTFTVGFVGKVRPWHGIPVLIDAFEMFHGREPRSRLLIIGEVPELASLMADLSARGLRDVVQFTGPVAPSQVPGLLASMDVAVAPYPNESEFYFSPLKVYEYMAAGLPVIASRVGQLARLIEHDVNGLFCPPGDPVALATALGRLRHEPALGLRLGRAARLTVLKDHTWEDVARRILDLANHRRSAQLQRAEAIP
jgi:glycosyltransferase involved in cell wall biosynthesis